VHVACNDVPAFRYLVHANFENSWLLSFEFTRILELVARVNIGLPMERYPIEWLALSTIFSNTLLAHYLDSVHVLFDLVDAVIKMVITIVEYLHNPAFILRSRFIVELTE